MNNISQVLREHWGFESLRPTQAQVVEAALAGREALAVMPTGGGKSLCYQLPPLVESSLTLVISPLIALMKDQVDGLRLNGVAAAALHSGISEEEQRRIEDQALAGELRLLYLSPERALTRAGLDLARQLPVKRLAIDEAHCISGWGHDFRPEYRRLRELRAALPEASTHAFTATATPQVREDILLQLGMQGAEQFIGVFDRPNLTYRTLPKDRPKDQAAELIGARPGEAAIVYCISRKDTEAMAEHLRDKGIDAQAYHAGLDAERRKRLSEAFAQERLDVVCATVAFGMGIDRPNVRLVLHESLPKSIEAFQQETGRAGRDGEPSDCVLLYRPSDAMNWRRMIQDGPDPQHNEVQLKKLDEMRRFAAGVVCRHSFLSRYFGQDLEPGCGACDNCLEPKPLVEGSTKIVQKMLVTVNDINRASPDFGYSARHFAMVLKGSQEAKVKQAGHTAMRGHGCLPSESVDQIGAWLEQLQDAGLIDDTGGKFPHLLVSEGGQELLKSRGEFGLRRIPETKPGRAPLEDRRKRRGAAASADLSPEDQELFERLRAKRRELAQEREVPAYVICIDATLKAMITARPTTPAEFEMLPGMSRKKAEEFAPEFVDVLANS